MSIISYSAINMNEDTRINRECIFKMNLPTIFCPARIASRYTERPVRHHVPKNFLPILPRPPHCSPAFQCLTRIYTLFVLLCLINPPFFSSALQQLISRFVSAFWIMLLSIRRAKYSTIFYRLAPLSVSLPLSSLVLSFPLTHNSTAGVL